MFVTWCILCALLYLNHGFFNSYWIKYVDEIDIPPKFFREKDYFLNKIEFQEKISTKTDQMKWLSIVGNSNQNTLFNWTYAFDKGNSMNFILNSMLRANDWRLFSFQMKYWQYSDIISGNPLKNTPMVVKMSVSLKFDNAESQITIFRSKCNMPLINVSPNWYYVLCRR